jgi:hypothetical protein
MVTLNGSLYPLNFNHVNHLYISIGGAKGYSQLCASNKLICHNALATLTLIILFVDFFNLKKHVQKKIIL